MPNSSADDAIAFFSTVMTQGYAGDFSAPVANLEHLYPEVERAAALSEKEFGEWLTLADAHHVTVRSLAVLRRMADEQQKKRLKEWCEAALEVECARTSRAVEWLYGIVQALEMSGCPVCVIKSLDHWPDLGSDLDLYTSGSPEQVISAMQNKLRAELEPRSWGDRLANKWNFKVPGLPESIEIHVRYLGQTGEQKLMASRVLERKTNRSINGRVFAVPAPEERILISTLQRMYRHFYFRLCDMADTAALLQTGSVNFEQLHHGAEVGGIWPGVASYLVIVSNYARQYGASIDLPREVVKAARAADLNVQFRDNFLRVPMGPAAGLYGAQLLSASLHGDVRALTRLPLLPPLAVSALVAYRLTGSDKGVW
jgi:hypothetical protein